MASKLGACLVVGGSGFLGSTLVDQLRAQETCTSIAVMDLNFPDYALDGVAFFKADITNRNEVENVLEQVRPTTIFNTASPHAYLDHVYAHLAEEVNVKGNTILLDIAATLGTVKAYVYTSSAPIIAGSGHAYSLANEEHATLAISGTGDPYHVAKAQADKLVLERNDLCGIKTLCIRPTAIYGDGDQQMMPATLKLLGTPKMYFWMGNNENLMDVVFVGNVAQAHIMGAHGLLRSAIDSTAPQVGGEAFNITDDSPANPWTFFGYFWSAAGNDVSVKDVWKINSGMVMFMAHSAELFVWLISLGKRRPKLLTIERMEFCVLTRTYCIDKAKRMLGYQPWQNVQYKDQLQAIQGTVADYMRQNPEDFAWPEFPFKLISSTGAKNTFGPPEGHACIDLARNMAMVHNSIFRALNAIYLQAGFVKPEVISSTQRLSTKNIQRLESGALHKVVNSPTPTSKQGLRPFEGSPLVAGASFASSTTACGTTRPNSINGETDKRRAERVSFATKYCAKDVEDFLLYCGIVYDFLHHHHTFEEKVLFPALEEAMQAPGHFQHEVSDHHDLEVKLDKLRAYAHKTSAQDYSATVLREIIDDFAHGLQQHMDSELGVILGLHTINSSKLEKIYEKWYTVTGHHSDIFKAGPLIFGCQDRGFQLDGQRLRYPHEPFYVPYAISWLVSRRHGDLWRFNPSDFHGRPRRPGLVSAAAAEARKKTKGSVVVPVLTFVVVLLGGVVYQRGGVWEGIISWVQGRLV